MLTNSNGDNRNKQHGNGLPSAATIHTATTVNASDTSSASERSSHADISERVNKSTAAKESGDQSAPPADVLTTNALELGEKDAQATPDAGRRNKIKGGLFKRLLIAVVVIFAIALVVIVAAYFVFFRNGAQWELTFHRKKTAATQTLPNEGGSARVSAEEIKREMAKGATPAPDAGSHSSEKPSQGEGSAVFKPAPTLGETYSALGGDPVTARLPNESFSATVTSSPEQSQSTLPSRLQLDTEARMNTTPTLGVASSRESANVSSRTVGSGQNVERSIRVEFVTNGEENDDVRARATRGEAVNGEAVRGSATITDRINRAADRPADVSKRDSAATSSPAVELPPLGTMLPVRTLGSVYTLRADTLVRMQLTRGVGGRGWSLASGTELYGVLRGSDYETSRAYVSLIGFVDPATNTLVRVSGNLLGGDGTDGVRGRQHRLNSRWSSAMRVAGAGALDVFGTVASAFGRRPILVGDVYGVANQRTVSPLLQEMRSSAAGKNRAGFVEVPAGTSGYVLVLTMPRSARGVDARPLAPDARDAIDLAGLDGDDLGRLASESEADSADTLSDAELSELLTTGTPQQIRAALPRMSPAMRRVAGQVLLQDDNN